MCLLNPFVRQMILLLVSKFKTCYQCDNDYIVSIYLETACLSRLCSHPRP